MPGLFLVGLASGFEATPAAFAEQLGRALARNVALAPILASIRLPGGITGGRAPRRGPCDRRKRSVANHFPGTWPRGLPSIGPISGLSRSARNRRPVSRMFEAMRQL